MRKINILLAILMFCQTLAFSQKLSNNFEVSIATPYPVINAGSKEYVSLDNGTVIMVKMGKGIVNIQKFDGNKNTELTRKTYKDLPKTAFFIDAVKLGSRIYYIYSVEEPSTKGFKVYAREIDTDDLAFKTPIELLKTSRAVVKAPFNGNLAEMKVGFAAYGARAKFMVHKSYDESKMMITYRSYPKTKSDIKNKDEIGFFVFDNKMEKIWGDEIKMPYTEKEMNNVGYSVSKSGQVMMLIAQRTKKKYEAFIIDSDGSIAINELDLSTEQLVKNINIREDVSGNFKCVAFYANGLDFKFSMGGSTVSFNSNGLMYFEIAKDGKLIKSKNFDFSDDFIKQNLSDRQKKGVDKREADGKAGIEDVVLTNFVIKDDGSAVIIGEQQYMRNEFMGPSQKLVYHFSNVIAIKVNSSGELAWMKKLAKNQAGTKGGGQMSISYMEGKTADYIAFVDNPKNINLDADGGVPEAHRDGKGGFLTTYKIDGATGKLEKHTLCDLNKIGKYKAYQFKAYRVTKAAENIFLMEVYIKGKKDTMIKFKVL
jgi:hypothetical protein